MLFFFKNAKVPDVQGGGFENPDNVGQWEGGGLKIRDFGGRPK